MYCKRDPTSLKVIANDTTLTDSDIVAMQIGNWYEFHAYSGDAQYGVNHFFLRQIVGDTLINSKLYFIFKGPHPDAYLRVQGDSVLYYQYEGDHVLFDFVLEEGMVINVETPYYELGFGGVQVEDTIVVTKNGYRFLTKSERKLNSI